MMAATPRAAAETRTLHLYNTHTHERAAITFKKNGRYIASGLRQLNRFLRDWRRNESIKMDPALFDLIWETYRRTGSNKDIHVVSGYRSPATNNMLRKRSRGVAKFSQHTLGKAMDFFIPGVDSRKIRVIGLREQVGGVGYYPRSASKFIHMDTGRVRHWPRMTRSQLVKVFPRGETLHVPSDGKPLKGYKLALARAKAGKRHRSRTVVASLTNPTSRTSSRNYTRSAEDPFLRQRGSGKGFLSALFSGGVDEEEDNGQEAEVSTPSGPTPPAPIRQAPADAPVQVATTAVPGVTPTDERPTATQAAQVIAAGPAPRPRNKPLALLANAEPASDEAAGQVIAALVPRAKPLLATTQLADAGPVSSEALPAGKPLASSDAAAVLAYGSAVPDSKPGSVLEATRDLAASETPVVGSIPSPRHRPQHAQLASLGPAGTPETDLSANAFRGKSDPVAPISAIRNRLRSRLFVDAQTTRTMSFANLLHPDQHSLTALLSKPNRTLANGFTGDLDTMPEPEHFSGPAIGSLTVVRLN